MNIEFKYDNNHSEILLEYSPMEENWVYEELFGFSEEVVLKRTFHFGKASLKNKNVLKSYKKSNEKTLFPEGEDAFIFKFARLDKNGYYKIAKNILDIKHDAFIHKSVKCRVELFLYGYGNISIFRKIDEICDESIYIGGEEDGAKSDFIPEKAFELLLKKFPSQRERKLYSATMISNVLKEYMGTMTDAEEKLQNFYKNKKKRLSFTQKRSEVVSRDIVPVGLYQLEIDKYKHIRDCLKARLGEEDNIDELQWQKFLMEFLLFIFPQYVAVLKSVSVNEKFFSDGKREIDFVLVNANGYIDIVEIKRPFEKALLASGQYRKNHYPHRQLSGTVMQAEKYLLYLKADAARLEKELTKKYKTKLPENLEIKIRNPHAKLIIGRSNKFGKKQKSDFEVIKRKYSNIADIMSYDDVLSYLDNIIACLEKRS